MDTSRSNITLPISKLAMVTNICISSMPLEWAILDQFIQQLFVVLLRLVFTPIALDRPWLIIIATEGLVRSELSPGHCHCRVKSWRQSYCQSPVCSGVTALIMICDWIASSARGWIIPWTDEHPKNCINPFVRSRERWSDKKQRLQ